MCSRLSGLDEITLLVVLGATGDLAKKKLFPALFSLYRRCTLPKEVRIVGFAPNKLSQEEFINRVKSSVKVSDNEVKEQLNGFCKLCTYVSGHDDGDKPYEALRDHLEELERGKQAQNRIFYLALPPSVFISVSGQLKKYCYSKDAFSRILIEKPFGRDLESSRELQRALEPNWREEEIFRIDHYLGKEMVNNILVLRFGNVILGSIWNREHIENIQVSIMEAIGTEGRGGFYNDTGIIRDVLQNHMLQIVSLLTMETPGSFSAEDLCKEKARVIPSMASIKPEDTIIGQYTRTSDGQKPGYKDDDSVPNDSRCPTFCAAIAYINNSRWNGVPILIKAGKALNESKTEIRIQFKLTSLPLLPSTTPNTLTIRVQPDEGVYLQINSNLPSLHTGPRTVPMDLDLTYRGRVPEGQIPGAYESLILDAVKGDYTHSVRGDELDASWRVFTPLLHFLDQGGGQLTEYAFGEHFGGLALFKGFTRD
ncbi:Glucose-6-phosphate 1-dehydrogenase [Pseudocyphellaria aurata]|nr:Glucose-6-phosphate 1-dehydrogenase [Pseudocyphellaria aurata]